ncbi:MAG: transporter substrate-binding domain-containing protein [Gammaproteobacteria bacterium]
MRAVLQLFLIFLICSQHGLVTADTSIKKIPLSQAERQWLADHPVVRIGGESDWPPYDFVDKQGIHVGVAADILKVIGKRLGVRFEVETGIEWPAMLEQVRNGNLYAVCTIASTPSRQKDFLFTNPYALSPVGLVTRNDTQDIQSLKQLVGKRVAIPAGYADIELLRARVANIDYLVVDSTIEALQAVQNKQADAFVGSIEVAAFLIDQNQLSDLHIAARNLPLRSNNLRIGVSSRYPLLAGIFQKGLNSLSLEESNIILKRWVTNLEFSQITVQRVILTDKEQAWLAANPVVRFTGDPNWLPFEAFDEKGEYIGIVSEFLNLIESRSGIKFKRIPSGTWLNALQMVRNNEVDVLSDDPSNTIIQDTLRFTEPYLEYPIGIVMRDEEDRFINDLYDISEKRIVVIEGYGYLAKLHDKYPEIDFITVKDVQEGLLVVSTGAADAFVSSLNLGSYHINQMGLNNLRLVGEVSVMLQIGLGVRRDMPELYSILNKTVATLTSAEKFRITEEWMHNKYVQHIDYTLLKWVLASAGLLLVSIIFWNRMLKSQVKIRTASLHQSQESLAKAQRIAHLGNWEWYFSKDTVSWSDEVYRLFGYQPKAIELTGKVFAKHLYPDDRAILSQAVKKASGNKQPVEVTFRILHQDQEIRYVNVQAEPLINDQKVIGLFGTIQDITIQKQAEFALRQSEEYYRRFVKTNTAGILNVEYRPPIPLGLPAEEQIKMFLENSYTLEINDVLARQLGYSSPEDCQGKNLGFHIDQTDPQNLKNLQQYITAGYKSYGALMHVRDCEGNDIYFLNNAHGFVEDNFLLNTWLSFVDITQRLKSEKAQQTSEQKFSKAFEHSPDPMSISKLSDGRFHYINKSFETISGYSKDEVLGRTPRELKLWSDRDAEKKLRHLMHARAAIRELDMAFITKSGEKRLTQISGGIFYIEDEPYLVLEIRDLTEKIGLEHKTRQQELQLIQANKMTALGTLLSGVGHEINNPNNLVMMNSQILEDVWPDIARAMEFYSRDDPSWQLAGLPYEEMQEVLPGLVTDIKDGAQRIQKIVSTLRDFARPGQSAEHKIYAVNDAVQQALSLLNHMIERNTNHFHLNLAENLPPVSGDPQKVEQVIINLVINALEALPDREHAISLSSCYNAGQQMIEIEVADEGSGISEEELIKIREPFFSTKLRTGGTGLGLAISDSLINEQGGYLSFNSEVGNGTQAVIHLPVSG